jgi:hypothetical protein
MKWFDYHMEMLHEFDVTVTLCFTPPSRGKVESITSPPLVLRSLLNLPLKWYQGMCFTRDGDLRLKNINRKGCDSLKTTFIWSGTGT